MASKLGKSVSQSLGGLGLASGSMLLRLRRTSIALLAIVGAVGLGLTIFISQLGWPAGLSGPLPGTPAKVGSVEQGVALTRPASPALAAGVPAREGGPAARARARGRGGVAPADRSAGKSRLGGSRQLAASNGGQSGADSGQPVSAPAPQPPAEPAPVASVPASPGTAPVAAGAGGPSTAASAKAANDGARSALATSKPQGPKTAGSNGSSPGTSKSGEAASNKTQRDASTAATTSSPTVPPTSAPAPANPAAAKEAADAAR